MAMGPFPASGKGKWNSKKSKEEIFSHLADHGIHMLDAKRLLDIEESKILAKNDGLMLIEAMNLVITGVNVLTSTWDAVVEFYKLEFSIVLESPEPPDIRITLIPRWIELALRSTRAAGGFDDAPIAPEDPATTDVDATGVGQNARGPSPTPPPLPDPPAKSAYELGIEKLTASIAAAEAKTAVVRSNLAAHILASKEESEKAERSELDFREDRLKKKAEAERKQAFMAELEKKLAAAERVNSELILQDDFALAALDTARKKQASFASLKASTRDVAFADTTNRSPSPAGDPKKLRLEDRLDSSDALLAKALAGGRMPPPPPSSAFDVVQCARSA